MSNIPRQQIISRLTKYAHPQWFHSLLELSTRELMALLSYYES